MFEGVELLDVAGPIEVFTTVNRLLGERDHGYQPILAAERRGVVRCAGGTSLVADIAWDELEEPVGTLIVPGGVRVTGVGVDPLVDPALVTWLTTMAELPSRIAAVCTGAHLLAAAGLLDGRRATTHWATASRLSLDHPDVRVEPDSIFVHDEHIWTSAGVSSGIDLALALTAADHNAELSRRAARWLVMYLRRTGGQRQYSELLARPTSTNSQVARTQEWISANLAANLANEALAARAGLSLRHFTRVFREQTGMSPAQYVEAVRVDAAVRLLVHTDDSLPSIARAVGFGSISTLHRAFKGHLDTSPADYRNRFTAS